MANGDRHPHTTRLTVRALCMQPILARRARAPGACCDRVQRAGAHVRRRRAHGRRCRARPPRPWRPARLRRSNVRGRGSSGHCHPARDSPCRYAPGACCAHCQAHRRGRDLHRPAGFLTGLGHWARRGVCARRPDLPYRTHFAHGARLTGVGYRIFRVEVELSVGCPALFRSLCTTSPLAPCSHERGGGGRRRAS
jgi:hypothetical protein